MSKHNLPQDERSRRVTLFEDLKSSFDNDLYAELDLKTAELIKPDSIKSSRSVALPTIDYRQETSTVAAMAYHDPAILVFGSAKHPGGGVTRGSKAQEEDIALVSTWYFQIQGVEGFFQDTRASAINTDNMLYAQNAYIVRDSNYQDIAPHKVSFIGGAAPNLTGLTLQNSNISEDEVYATMERRIHNLLVFLESRGKKIAILGAWGCGVFGLRLDYVAALFAKKLSEGLFSGTAVFAVPHKETLQVFKNIIRQ